MKTFLAAKMMLFAAFGLFLIPARGAENAGDDIQLNRAIYRTDRQTFLMEAMPLTDAESAAFWPIYRSYRADMEKLGDGILKLVLEYADVYPDVPEDRARRLLKDYATLEEKLTKKRAHYLKRAAKVIPAAKVLRWAQLENRLDLALRLQIANAVPVAPGSPSKP